MVAACVLRSRGTSISARLHQEYKSRSGFSKHTLGFVEGAIHTNEGGLGGQTLPPSQYTQDDSLPIELREHIHRLRIILPVISVSVMALNLQNAELDHDIAKVLSEHAGEPLDSEIEHLEHILATLSCNRRQQEVCA